MTELAKDYGAALFALGKEDGTLESLSAGLVTVSRAFADNPQYLMLLSTPNIPAAERTALLDEAFASSVDRTALTFVKLLCEKGYIRSFEECKAAFDALVTEDSRTVIAKVTSAVPLTDAEKATLIERLQAMDGRTVTAVYTQDASLLGGVVVELDDRILDGSLKRQIRQLKEVIEP